MNTTLIGSGTRCFAMVDPNGNTPWLHWAIFRNFLLQHISGRSILIGGDNFKDHCFQEFLLSVCSKVTVISNEQIRRSPKIFSSNNPSIAFASATDSTPEIVIIGDNHLPELFSQNISQIHYMQIDMNLLSPSLSFPKINDQNFRKVSWMDSREEIWHLNQGFFGDKPKREVNTVQFQHWLPKKVI